VIIFIVTIGLGHLLHVMFHREKAKANRSFSFAVLQLDDIGDSRHSDDELKVKFAAQALRDYFEMQHAEKAAAISFAERA